LGFLSEEKKKTRGRKGGREEGRKEKRIKKKLCTFSEVDREKSIIH